MRKTLAFVLSLFALAYVGLVYADDGENGDGQNIDREQQKDQNEDQKQEREKIREQEKQKFEQERESLKQEWEKTRESVKNEREQFKEQLSQRLEEKKNLLAEFKNKFADDRCAKIEEKIQERTSHFDERESAHQKVYVNLENRISKFISQFAVAGIDEAKITPLRAHLSELQAMRSSFKEDYAKYIASLKGSKNLTCGHSEGEFRASLVETKVLLKAVHTDAAAIRTYVRTVILPEIKVLKAQMPEEQDNEN